MKHINMIAIAIIATIIVGCTQLQAVANFELFNKSNEGIEATVNYGNGTQTLTINPGQQQQAFFKDTSANLRLKIVGRASKKTTNWQLDASDKTKYVSYNPQKTPALYPQTGPLMGFMGKTESGLSLKNNLKASEIHEIK